MNYGTRKYNSTKTNWIGFPKINTGEIKMVDRDEVIKIAQDIIAKQKSMGEGWRPAPFHPDYGKTWDEIQARDKAKKEAAESESQ